MASIERFDQLAIELPHLPLEVHHHILRLCDPSTLAITSRVSFAFLELSSPLLYNDIAITLGKQTELLFSERDESISLPHLTPYLSLPTQIHSLTILATRSSPLNLTLSPSRLASSPLSVSLLTLRPPSLPSGTRNAPVHPWTTLLALLSPSALHWHALPLSDVSEAKQQAPFMDNHTAAFAFRPLGRLRRVILSGMTHGPCIGILLTPSLPRRAPPSASGEEEDQTTLDEMVFDLSWYDPDRDLTDSEEEIWECVMGEMDETALRLNQPDPVGRVRKTVLKFRDERARAAFREDLLETWERWGEETLCGKWLDERMGEGRIGFEVV